jgi:hypothetical protein
MARKGKSTEEIIGFLREAKVRLVSEGGEITAGEDKISVPLFELTKGHGFESIFETSEYRITISGSLNPDPSIAYGIAVVDFGAPTLFGFSFFTPIVPTGPATTVDASIVGGLTDFTGDGGRVWASRQQAGESQGEDQRSPRLRV